MLKGDGHESSFGMHREPHHRSRLEPGLVSSTEAQQGSLHGYRDAVRIMWDPGWRRSTDIEVQMGPFGRESHRNIHAQLAEVDVQHDYCIDVCGAFGEVIGAYSSSTVSAEPP